MGRWPAALVKPPDGMVTDPELDEFLGAFRKEVGRRRAAYVTVVDLRGNSGITPTQRKRLSEYMRETEALGAPCRGSALVFESALLRTLLTAIFWLKQPKYPVQVFATLDDAVRWAHELAAAPAPLHRSA